MMFQDMALTIPQSRNAIQEEMEQLRLKLREAEVAQKGLELLKVSWVFFFLGILYHTAETII